MYVDWRFALSGRQGHPGGEVFCARESLVGLQQVSGQSLYVEPQETLPALGYGRRSNESPYLRPG